MDNFALEIPNCEKIGDDYINKYIRDSESISELEKIKNAIIGKLDLLRTRQYQILRKQLLEEWFILSSAEKNGNTILCLIRGWQKIDFRKTFFPEPADEYDFNCENESCPCDAYISSTFYRFLLWESIMLCEFCHNKLKFHFVDGEDVAKFFLEEFKSWSRKRKFNHREDVEQNSGSATNIRGIVETEKID